MIGVDLMRTKIDFANCFDEDEKEIGFLSQQPAPPPPPTFFFFYAKIRTNFEYINGRNILTKYEIMNKAMFNFGY